MRYTTNLIMSQTPDEPQLPPVQNMILTGVQDSLGKIFGIPSERIVFFATTNRMRIIEHVSKMHSGVEGKITWPVLLLHVNSLSLGMTENMHSFNTKSLARHGSYLKLSESKTRVLNAKLVPVVTEIEIIYMTDDFKQAFGYANSWVTNAISNRLNFTITYAGLPIDIRCEMSPQLSTPDREASVEQPNVFEYIGTIKVVGYSSDTHPDGTSYVQVLSKPVINASIEDFPDEDKQVWSGRHMMPIIKETQ